jgi:hypothetical protein
MSSAVVDLALLHGLFNAAVGLLLFYQGWLGLKIRRARRRGRAFPISSVRRHRKIGPVLPYLPAIGFAAGLWLIMLDHRPLLVFPAHFFLGLSIVLLLLLMRRLGARIKGPLSPVRTPHLVIGIALLVIYVVQAGLGLSLLL